MAKAKTKPAEAPQDNTAIEFDPAKLEQEPSREPGDDTDSINAERIAQAQAVVRQVPQEQNGHAAGIQKKQYKPIADPFGTESIKGERNKVRLLKSEGHRAWVIRFIKNPNETDGYNKENPHPVLKMLKDEGYRWGFDEGDGKGGWGKAWTNDPYGADHIDARRVLAKAAEMIGAKIEQGQGVSA